jgi:hypothetical protein
MAFHRRVFDEWGGFDERLGRGAPLPSCEEHLAFAQLIERGYAVVYTPEARVRHPIPRTLEQRQKDYIQSRADLAAYAVFLFVVTSHKWRVARYVSEAAIGTRRSWRFHTARSPTVSRWRLARTYAAGAYRGLLTSIEPAMPSHPAPSSAPRTSENAKASFIRVDL